MLSQLNPKLAKTLANALLFQLGWFVCVLGGAAVAIPYTLLFLLLHYRYFVDSRDDWLFIAVVALAGCLIDSFMILSGTFSLLDGSALIPLWLVCLWCMFAVSLRFCFAFLHQRPALAAILGAGGATTSYYGGILMNDNVILAAPLWSSLLIIAVVWALFMPFAIYTAHGGLMARREVC